MSGAVQNGSIPESIVADDICMSADEVKFDMEKLMVQVNDQTPTRKHYEVDTLDGIALINRVEDVFSHEEGYLNITPIARHFGKSKEDMAQYFNSNRFKDYALASWDFRQSRVYENIHSRKGQVVKNHHLKKLEVARRPLKFSVKGGKYQGTYIHADIVLEVARFLNPSFAVKLDHWTRGKVFEEIERATEAKALAKINASLPVMVEKRSENKSVRKEFNEAINEIYILREKVTGKKRNERYFQSFSKLINKVQGLGATPVPMPLRAPLDWVELDEDSKLQIHVANRIMDILSTVGDDYKKVYAEIADELLAGIY